MIANLGINDASINYEVALEFLGLSMQPFMRVGRDSCKKQQNFA